MGGKASEVIRSIRDAARALPGEVRGAWRETPVALFVAVVGVVALGRVALAHLASLGEPLIAYEGHHWRQSFTYGVAWNFAHLSLDVLHPRMFVELTRSNIIPMEAPLYPFLA